MRRILSILALISVSVLGYSQDDKFMPAANQGMVVKHDHYILSYVEKYEGAEWVCYELTYDETRNNADRKSGKFLDDPLVATKSATHDDYTNSGYDRGHLAPAGDMNFSADAEWDSFYMSNVLPQKAGLNRFVWKYLEDDIREYVIRNKSHLHIITGGIFPTKPTCIGKYNKIAVPTYFYKIIYDDINDKVLAVIMPNIDNPESNYSKYIVNISEIEKQTGIDFPINDNCKNFLK